MQLHCALQADDILMSPWERPMWLWRQIKKLPLLLLSALSNTPSSSLRICHTCKAEAVASTRAAGLNTRLHSHAHTELPGQPSIILGFSLKLKAKGVALSFLFFSRRCALCEELSCRVKKPAAAKAALP